MRRCLLLLLGLFPGACTVGFDLSPLDEGCGPNLKGCPDATCVALDDPATGCAQADCQPCFPPNGLATCVEGECAVRSCSWPWDDCDGVYENGCEANLVTDTENCGGCLAKACANVTLTHAEPACANSACGIRRCDPGFADCDGAPEGGCEVDLRADAAHCGSCFSPCPVDQICDDGVCVP